MPLRILESTVRLPCLKPICTSYSNLYLISGRNTDFIQVNNRRTCDFYCLASLDNYYGSSNDVFPKIPGPGRCAKMGSDFCLGNQFQGHIALLNMSLKVDTTAKDKPTSTGGHTPSPELHSFHIKASTVRSSRQISGYVRASSSRDNDRTWVPWWHALITVYSCPRDEMSGLAGGYQEYGVIDSFPGNAVCSEEFNLLETMPFQQVTNIIPLKT